VCVSVGGWVCGCVSACVCVVVSVCVCVCVCIMEPAARLLRHQASPLTRGSLLSRRGFTRVGRLGPNLEPGNWPLQDILSRLGFCARINHPLIAPPTCIAHTVAILLQCDCAIFDPLPTPRFHAIHYTIVCIAISCQG